MHAATPPFFTVFLLISVLLKGGWGAVGCGHQRGHHGDRRMFGFRPTKLFVFGDSYVDTGNSRMSRAWKKPYGLTFPGKPAGRFSDGRVLTDYFARWIDLKTPIPYRFRNVGDGDKVLRYGVNFALGGTGVFDTETKGPNLTAQIDQFQQLMHDDAFTPADIRSSIVLINDAGNDYIGFIARNPSLRGKDDFIRNIVKQIVIDLKRIQRLGVRKIVFTALPPIGCAPMFVSHRHCDESLNVLSGNHNSLLSRAVAKLNSDNNDSRFVILDLYDAFMTVIKKKGEYRGSSKFKNPFTPCCAGNSTDDGCGDVDKKGQAKFTVCCNREAAFFWDDGHPTQAGWRALSEVMQHSLNNGV